MPTVTENLDFAPGIGQRQATFDFQLIDADSDRPLGTLHPVRDSPPLLQHDTTRTVKRTLTGLHLSIDETALIDPLSMRVTVAMVLGGSSFPLGTYVFTDSTRIRDTAGRQATTTLADLGFIVAQKTEHTTSVAVGTNIGEAIESVLEEVTGLGDYFIDPTNTVAGSPLAWPANTDRARILDDLAALGSFFSPYMGNDSALHFKQIIDPAGEFPDFTYGPNGRIWDGSISENDDLLDAPNRFIVIDNANTDLPIVGTYDVPVTARHSIAQRGFVIPDVTDVQGLGTQTAADEAARTRGLQRTLFERTTFSSPPDPRHDGYAIVSYDGANWLEVGWTMELVEGGNMSHSLRRAYG